MFGGMKFEPYIGQLSLGMAGEERSQEEMIAQSKERVETLKGHLLKKLDIYVQGGNKDAFRQQMEAEADDLRHESYGVELLHAIGYIYDQKAKQFLGSVKSPLGLKGMFYTAQEVGHMVSTGVSAFSAAGDLQRTAGEIEREEQAAASQGLEIDPQRRQQLEQQAQMKGMAALWAFNKVRSCAET